jgi:hypothetical protein
MTPTPPRSRNLLLISTLLLVAFAGAALAREFAMPPLRPAAQMPVHFVDTHEHVAIGAESYDTPAQAAIFHSKLLEHSVLPVLVVFTNESSYPIVLDGLRFRLVTRDRAKASPYTLDDLERVFTSIRAPHSRPQDNLPMPTPSRNKPHGFMPREDYDELKRAIFHARTVEPHSSVYGFLFFDVTDLPNPSRGARLYAEGLQDAGGRELMYFELELAPQR